MTEALLTRKKETDLFTYDGLTKQTGTHWSGWDTYILKELIDNAIDICESSNVEPEVTINVSDSRISIRDNGQGLTREVIDKITDLNIYAGTKYYYKRPARGAQGNALRTILPMPYVLSGEKITECAIIYSSNKEYRISLNHDKVQQDYYFSISESESATELKGTEIIINISLQQHRRDSNCDLDDIKQSYITLIHNFAVFNPHCKFTANLFGDIIVHGRIGDIQTLKSDSESIHWYSYDAFRELIFAHIREGHGETTIKNFCMGRFRGINNSTKTEVLLQLMSSKKLIDLKNNEKDIRQLYANLKQGCRVLKPSVLGSIGEDRLLSFFGDNVRGGMYKKIELNHEKDGCIMPFVIEGAAVQSINGDKSQLYAGLNNSPLILQNSLSEIVFQRWDNDLYVSREDGILIALHIICPSVNFSNYSKASFDLSPFLSPLQTVLKSILKDYYESRDRADKERQKIIKQQQQKQAEKEKREKSEQKAKEHQKKQTIKDIFRETWQKAFNETTDNGIYAADIRQVFYKHRPLIEERTEKEKISYDYYSQLVEELEMEVGRRLVNRETRGELVLPRSTERLPINTKFSVTFVAPQHEFNKILYIEKRGFLDVLIENQIHSKYDIALMGGQGFLTWDIKKVISNIVKGSDGEITVFCLHDCDISGIHILNASRKKHYIEGTKVNIIDMGITPKEAIGNGYPVELNASNKSYNYETVQDIISLDEFKWLTQGDGHRVELNIFSPSEFVIYVETKLKEFGVTKKVLPDIKVIEGKINETVESKKESMIDFAVEVGLLELYNSLDKLKAMIVDEDRIRTTLKEDFDKHIKIDSFHIRDCIEKDLEKNPVESWKHFTQFHVEKQLGNIEGWSDCIKKAVKASTNSKMLESLKSVVNKISKNSDFVDSIEGM